MIFVFDETTGKRTRLGVGDRIEISVLGGATFGGTIAEAGGMRLDETSRKDFLFKKHYHHYLMQPVLVDGDHGVHYLHVVERLKEPPEVPTLPVPVSVTVVERGDESADDDGPTEAELKLVAVVRRAAIGERGDEYLLCLMAP